MNYKIGVLGGGSWGTALANLLAKKGHHVEIWTRREEHSNEINENKTNLKYLPGIFLSKNIESTTDIKKVVKGKDLILQAVPTHGVRETFLKIKEEVEEDQIIVNVSKGIENDTLMRISEIIFEILPNNPYVVLSGPSHAEEVARELPTTVIAASENYEKAKLVQDIFMNESFRVYTNKDVIGVELGGAIKNVIALGAGISDGLNYGDNAKAALMNRGIFEMARLGETMGADMNTFFGLSGIGDLIVTCTSEHSRNKKAGMLLGQGLTLEEAIEKTGMVVEGVKTTKSTYSLAKKHNVNMPITKEIYNVLYKEAEVKEAVRRLMVRKKKGEMDNLIEKDFYQ